MNKPEQVANIVDDLCRRQDVVLKELDQLERQIEGVLRSLTNQPQPAVVAIPVINHNDSRRAA